LLPRHHHATTPQLPLRNFLKKHELACKPLPLMPASESRLVQTAVIY
jgi:hypothetical protein